MAGPWQWTGTTLSVPVTTGLLGGSFNPAHKGHRAISDRALAALNLDELWWMVSPGNPLKANATDMAPLPARLASAQRQSRRSRIKATAIEREFGTVYTIDTLRKLVARYPKRRFIWIIGGDNLVQLHKWRHWRQIARIMPIAVIARPGYNACAVAAPAMAWFRRAARPALPRPSTKRIRESFFAAPSESFTEASLDPSSINKSSQFE